MRRLRAIGLCVLLGVLTFVAPNRATSESLQPTLVLANCPAIGDAAKPGSRADPDLNAQKNRTEVPGNFTPTHFDDFAEFEVPDGVSKRHRSTWPEATRSAVLAQEAQARRLTGFLIAQKLEGPESCNCHGEDQRARDIHLWLANSQGGTKVKAIVVEVAPRVRAMHSTWTLQKLRQLVQAKTRVRISGWVLLDEEHPEQVGGSRHTLWELHPIMRIEVRVGNRWREL
jgi:hypothetical protein